MTNTTRTGTYCATPGSTLDLGDYVEFRGVWFKLTEVMATSRYNRHVRGVAKDGSRRALLLNERIVKAYRLHR